MDQRPGGCMNSHGYQEPPGWVLEDIPADGVESEDASADECDVEPDIDFDSVDDDYRDQEGEFGEPIDILGNADITGHPQLDAECIPTAIFRYAKAEGERLTADPIPIAIHCLAAVATAASDEWKIKPKQHDKWTQQARIWTCNVKPAGARGTDMLRAAFWPIELREKELRKAYQQEIAAWNERNEGLKPKELADAKKTDPEPRQERLLTNDATPEALSELLRGENEAAKIGYYADELATFLDFGRYKNGKGGGGASRAVMLQAFDGGPQQIDRIMRGSIFVANWSVCIAGNIQPRKLAELGTDLSSDGLFQRFIVVHAREQDLYDDDDKPTDAAAGSAYRDIIDALFEMKPPAGADGNAVPCFLDAEGRRVRRGLMQLVQRLQHDQSLPDIIRESASKWSGLFARLTLIFHLVELATAHSESVEMQPSDMARIPAETARRAANLIRRVLLPNLFRLGFETLPDGKEQANARWIAEHILAHKLEHISARDIGRAKRQLRGKPQEIAMCMAMLSDAGWVTQTEAKGDGIRWKINPAVHQKFATAAADERQRRARVVQLIRKKVADL